MLSSRASVKKLVSDNYAQMGKKMYFVSVTLNFHTTTIVYIVNLHLFIVNKWSKKLNDTNEFSLFGAAASRPEK